MADKEEPNNTPPLPLAANASPIKSIPIFLPRGRDGKLHLPNNSTERPPNRTFARALQQIPNPSATNTNRPQSSEFVADEENNDVNLQPEIAMSLKRQREENDNESVKRFKTATDLSKENIPASSQSLNEVIPSNVSANSTFIKEMPAMNAMEAASFHRYAAPPIYNPAIQSQSSVVSAKEAVNIPRINIRPTANILRKSGFILKREQMIVAQEIFRTANKLVENDKTIILSFMAGCRENPFAHIGDVVKILLSEREQNSIRGANVPMIVETLIELNYITGEWRRLVRNRLKTTRD